MQLTAYVDESARRRRDESTCAYTLAAVLVAETDAEAVRATMRGLRYGRSQVVHWRVERAERRKLIAGALAELPVTGVVTVCLHAAEVKSERARRRCLVRLLVELAARGVDRVVFEARLGPLDDADRRVLTGLRRADTVPAEMVVTWEPPAAPELWAADCIAGAISWWLDGDDRYFEPLQKLVTLVDVDAD